MSDSLNEKVNYILEDSDFNDLPFEERKRIGKYMAEQQILTLHQVINKDKAHTTEAWRKKTTSWLKNCVDTFYKEYRYPADRKTENSSEKPNKSDIPTSSTVSKMEQVETMSCAECKHRPIGAEICEEPCHYEPQTDWHYDEQDATWYPYKHEDEPQPQTCSFSDCDNFKNPDYERCIECKRKQIKLKTEQTERSSDDIHIKSSTADRSLSARTRNRNNNSDGHIVFSEVTERSE